jgi:hypothetical protein
MAYEEDPNVVYDAETLIREKAGARDLINPFILSEPTNEIRDESAISLWHSLPGKVNVFI